MSKFLTYEEISYKLLGYSLTIIEGTDDYLTKSQVVSQFSNEDYDETKLNNVKGDNYFVTDDDIVQSPRYALQVIFADSHVESVTISVSGELTKPTSDNTSDDNDVSPSSLSGGTIIDKPTKPGGTIDKPEIDGPELVMNNFIKIGKSRTIKKTSTVYIPAGARVNFSSTYESGYKEGSIIKFISSMNSDKIIQFSSVESTTTHNHTNSGTVHVTFNKHNSKDTISYQVYHTYNNSTCIIKTGNIDGTSATITTPTYGNSTSILFIMTEEISSNSSSYVMRVNSSSNVTATAFQSGGGSSTEEQLIGPLLDLKNIKSGWSVSVTIY